MSKSHNVSLKKNELLLLNFISSFFVYFLEFEVLWVCQVKIYINDLSFRGKGTTKKIMKKMNLLNFKF
jgi:hypothetical protein